METYLINWKTTVKTVYEITFLMYLRSELVSIKKAFWRNRISSASDDYQPLGLRFPQSCAARLLCLDNKFSDLAQTIVVEKKISSHVSPL